MTGDILGTITQPDNQPAQPNSVEGLYSASDYVWDGEGMKEVSDWDPVVETNKVSGLPAGTKVSWGASEVVVDDGEVELDLVPGQRITVMLRADGYAHKHVEVRG